MASAVLVEVRALSRLVERSESVRFLYVLGALEVLTDRGSWDLGVLLKVAGLQRVCPIMSRWSRAALGLATRLFPLEEDALKHLRSFSSLSVEWPRSFETSSDLVLWLDVCTGSIYSLDESGGTINDVQVRGQSLSLTLWSLLEVLVRTEAWVDKGTISEVLWPEEPYHPLRHDARIWQNIWRLKHTFENVLGRAGLIETGPRGYRLRCKIAVVHAWL